VNDEPVRMQVRENLTELLCGPLCDGMLRTWQCRMRREPISIATNTYSSRKVTVIDTKKSQATIAFAWLRTNVAQH
jgi:hypothetical protein